MQLPIFSLRLRSEISFAGKNVIDTQGDKGPDEALLAFAIRELIGEDRGSIYTEVDEAPPPETDGIIPAGVVI